ncbi:MAG TPA: hypothetical protein VHI52_04305 [Verrucomicrobiae bacterium]|nr:hypothetical protein [Verrucomicrobiae bacterium]
MLFVCGSGGAPAYPGQAFGELWALPRRLENISGFQWCLIIWLLLSLGFLVASGEGLWWRI